MNSKWQDKVLEQVIASLDCQRDYRSEDELIVTEAIEDAADCLGMPFSEAWKLYWARIDAI